MAEDNRRKKFYWDFGINPAYIGALLTCLIGVFAWARGVDNGQVQQDEKIVAIEKTVTDNEKRSREDMKEIRDGIRQILEQEERERHRQ